MSEFKPGDRIRYVNKPFPGMLEEYTIRKPKTEFEKSLRHDAYVWVEEVQGYFNTHNIELVKPLTEEEKEIRRMSKICDKIKVMEKRHKDFLVNREKNKTKKHGYVSDIKYVYNY